MLFEVLAFSSIRQGVIPASLGRCNITSTIRKRRTQGMMGRVSVCMLLASCLSFQACHASTAVMVSCADREQGAHELLFRAEASGRHQWYLGPWMGLLSTAFQSPDQPVSQGFYPIAKQA